MTVEQGLNICYKTANILKTEFPNEIMSITPTTIIEHSVKNSRLLHGTKSMANRYAYYTNMKPHRIVIKQKTLTEQSLHSTYGSHQSLTPNIKETKIRYIFAKCKRCKTKFDDEYRTKMMPSGNDLNGNWALIDLMCHELAHHRTKGHGMGFKVKYQKFLNYMVNQIIGGNYYGRI